MYRDTNMPKDFKDFKKKTWIPEDHALASQATDIPNQETSQLSDASGVNESDSILMQAPPECVRELICITTDLWAVESNVDDYGGQFVPWFNSSPAPTLVPAVNWHSDEPCDKGQSKAPPAPAKHDQDISPCFAKQHPEGHAHVSVFDTCLPPASTCAMESTSGTVADSVGTSNGGGIPRDQLLKYKHLAHGLSPAEGRQILQFQPREVKAKAAVQAPAAQQRQRRQPQPLGQGDIRGTFERRLEQLLASTLNLSPGTWPQLPEANTSVAPSARAGTTMPMPAIEQQQMLPNTLVGNPGRVITSSTREVEKAHMPLLKSRSTASTTSSCTDLGSCLDEECADSASDDDNHREVFVGPTHLAVLPFRLEDCALPDTEGPGNSVQFIPLKSGPRCLSLADARRLEKGRPGQAPLSFGSTLHLTYGDSRSCRPCMFERWAGRCTKGYLCDFCHLHVAQKRRMDGQTSRRTRNTKTAFL